MKAPELPPTDHRPAPYTGPSFQEAMELRQTYLTPSLVTFYQRPIMIVEGGLRGNVLRIKPPMCINMEDADFIVDVLDIALAAS